ncbi:MAG: hypothetical protein IPM29_29695 [Planctomycetes bacterium]|nr:hypothetical protein [Planctomycetota bacterium]
MKLLSLLIPAVLLASLANAQSPPAPTAEELFVDAVSTLGALDFANQTPEGGGGQASGGSSHGSQGHGQRGQHGRGSRHHERRNRGGCHNRCTWPQPQCVRNTRLPIVTDDCAIVRGRCLDLIDEVRFDCRTLEEDGTIGDGYWSVDERGEVLEVCPPQCLRPGCHEVSLYYRGCRVARFTMRLFEPTVPTIACDAELSVGETQCIYVHDGGVPQPNNMYILVSPDNTPSVYPGIVELGLGNNFTNYYCGVGLTGPCAFECIGAVPAELVGHRLYFQMAVLNAAVPILPLPTTGVCTTEYVR